MTTAPTTDDLAAALALLERIVSAVEALDRRVDELAKAQNRVSRGGGRTW